MSTRGSVKKDPSGHWYFVVDLPTPGGARKQARRRGFATKREAQAALDLLVGQVVTGLYVDPSRLTVGEYLTEHWLPAMASTVRPTTADTYGRLVRLHLVPSLGAVRLQQLERAHVSRWLAGLTAGGLSPKSVRNVHGVLVKALADAVELELVGRNAAAKPRGLPPAKRPAPRAWSGEQLGAFLAATSGDRLAPVWRLLAATGCRRGEVLGLRWSEVDLDAGTATIVRQRTIAGGRLIEGSPKTSAGARTVALDAGTVRELRAWRRVQSAERLLMGAGWADTGLVFTNPDGGGIWPQRVTARFRELAEGLGLPLIGVHGLRHSAASFMIASGVNPKVVQARLGHAHVSVTLGLYTHVLPAHDRAAADALGAALDGNS